MTLHGERRRIVDLTGADIRRMLALMTAHYDGVDPAHFRADLAEKEGAFLLVDDDGAIQGFSTYRLDQVQYRGQVRHYVFSGDTIIDRDHWGNPELFRMFGVLLREQLDAGRTPFYWLLLSKGIKTYGLLPLYFRHFHPGTTAPGDEEAELAGYLAGMRYGAHYIPERGIVRFDPPRDRLKPELCVIAAEKADKPQVRAFLERNPGYADGDELVCLARIDPENLTRAGRRFLPLS